MDARQVVAAMTQEYHSGPVGDAAFRREVDGETVEFFPVGHNASHCFYAGASKDGQLLKLSVEPGYTDGDYVFETTYHVTPAGLESYWGHY